MKVDLFMIIMIITVGMDVSAKMVCIIPVIMIMIITIVMDVSIVPIRMGTVKVTPR